LNDDAQWRDLERSAILVVDDEVGIRGMIEQYLTREGYEVVTAATLGEARKALVDQDILVVIADIILGQGENGLDLLSEVRRDYPEMDIMMMTANGDLSSAVEAIQQGAYDYLCKPFPFEVLGAAVERAVERRRLRMRASMLERLDARQSADQENLREVLSSMATIIDAKSPFTARHSTRVSDLARLLAEALGFDEERTAMIAFGGRLHDIGKIGTPDAILNKPGPLTKEEFTIIKQHPVTGDELLAPIRTMQELRPMIRWHHETLDGRGYPDGLAGDDVPVEAWVVKVSDMWEAITSRRPYRDPMSVEEAVKVLRGESGARIPEEIVETFLDAIQGAPVALPLAND